jgi:hypothetical protein
MIFQYNCWFILAYHLVTIIVWLFFTLLKFHVMSTFFTLHFWFTGIMFLDFFHLPNCMWERYKMKPWVEDMKTYPTYGLKVIRVPLGHGPLVRTHYGVPLSNGTVKWIHPVSVPGSWDTCSPNSFKFSSYSHEHIMYLVVPTT